MSKKILFKGNEVTLKDTNFKEGDNFPNFTAATKELEDFSLNSLHGRVVVLNTFPSVDTGICALQTVRFNKEVENFDNLSVVTVSKDLPFALGRFCAANDIKNAITVSDYKYRQVEDMGLLIEELGLLARAVYVIDKEGIIRHVEICEEVANEPDYTKALEVVKTLI